MVRCKKGEVNVVIHVSGEEEVSLENVADGMSEVHLGRREKKRLLQEGKTSAKEEQKRKRKEKHK